MYKCRSNHGIIRRCRLELIV